MTLSLANAYHTGYVVPALEPAMEEFAAAFGVTWTSIEDRPMSVTGVDGPVRTRLRFVYSTQGPHHIELLEAVPDTIWALPAPERGGSAHHVGVWTDDFANASERLVAAGIPRVLTFNGGDGRALGFAYHRLPNGALVELVDAANRPALEAWLAGGDYPVAGRRS